MLFYNSRKEFVGIDEQDLNSLGFSNLSELRSQSADFADLFVRTPGFIHNFKYVHWIDYISYGGSNETPKAIIHTKNKNFWCNLDITTSYMVDNPATKSYLVHLRNLRELTKQETVAMTNDILEKPAPESEIEVSPPVIDQAIHDSIENSILQQNNSYSEVDNTYKVPETPKKVVPKKKVVEKVVEKEEEPLDIPVEEEKESEELFEITEVAEEKVAVENNDDYNSSYVFDPFVASEELGLPIDLIEEFIEDFIAQAKEFKDELYAYTEDEDINNVRILSHKLKGVAANLRVEDAFEVLATINTTTDLDVIHKNLGYLYIIIAKLNGEEPEMAITKEVVPEEDDFILDFKELELEKEIEIEMTNETIETVETVEYDDSDDSDDIFLSIDEDLSLDVPLEIELDMEDDTVSEVLPIYDTVMVAQQMGLDSTTFDEFLSDYLTDAREICNNIENAVSSNNFQKWNEEVIKLKGMSEQMRMELFIQELETLLETKEQDVAFVAINKIISIISNIKV